MKYLPPVQPKLVPKSKLPRIYGKLEQLIFQISRFWFQKLLLITTCKAQIGPKIKSAQNLLKFGTFNISNMPISSLNPKMILIKYLPPVRPKLVPKWKMLRIYWSFGTRDISNIPILILMSKIIFIKYVPLVRPKLIPKLKVLRIYWNLAYSIFQICKSGFWCQKWFLWNIYQVPDQVNPNIKITLKFMFDISSIPILIMRSDKSFIEHLLHVMPKLISDLEFQSRL